MDPSNSSQKIEDTQEKWSVVRSPIKKHVFADHQLMTHPTQPVIKAIKYSAKVITGHDSLQFTLIERQYELGQRTGSRSLMPVMNPMNLIVYTNCQLQRENHMYTLSRSLMKPYVHKRKKKQ